MLRTLEMFKVFVQQSVMRSLLYPGKAKPMGMPRQVTRRLFEI